MRHLEILAQQIASRGVKHAFGIPGSGPSLFLIDALEKCGVRYHLTHFEGTAAMMAGAIGRGASVLISVSRFAMKGGGALASVRPQSQ